MGVVYRAHEPELRRRVAIKFLRPKTIEDADPQLAHELRHRFIQEARAAAALSHPGVTTIYRVGEAAGSPFIAMEWLEGRTLERMLADEGRLRPARAAQIGLELLDALEAAHRAGVVHRDIKPANLVLLASNRLKVTDFGIAFVSGSDLVKTQTGLILATPQFASPEQFTGTEVDGRCDIWAAGVVLYLALSGRYPFLGQTILQLITSVTQKEPAPLDSLVPGLPAGLAAVVHRALEKDRDDRFRTAGEMAEALRPFSTGQPAPQSAHGTAQFVSDTAATVVGSLLDVDTLSSAPTAPMASPTLLPAAFETRVTAMPIEPPRYPRLTGLPRDEAAAVAAVVRAWPSRALGRTATGPLVDRLMERPLHTTAFSGAVEVEGSMLLVSGGFVLGAVTPGVDAMSDEVCEWLPADGEATLYTLPKELPDGLVEVLASLLHPPAVRLADLDSSIVNLAALAEKLAVEKFDGVLRLRRHMDDGPDVFGCVLFVNGETALTFFSEGWDGYPVDESWSRWVSTVPLAASLEERTWHPALLSFRRELADFELAVSPSGQGPSGKLASGLRVLQRLSKTASPVATSFRVAATGSRATAAMAHAEALVAQDPAHRFLCWALETLPAYFAERERSNRWKYLSEWLGMVRKARLHHSLPRPDSRESDLFDLVTFDDHDKVLHLAQRVATGNPATLRAFLDRAIEAKTARIKTGDVGGAFLIAPAFEESTIDAYREATTPEHGTKTLFGFEEKLTGYEGFVRIGPRRGFHLLLVAETEAGFEPVLL